jgi:hypothetical protein
MMKAGDIVNVFGGSSMPFVLRNADTKKIAGEGTKTSYQLLDEC